MLPLKKEIEEELGEDTATTRVTKRADKVQATFSELEETLERLKALRSQLQISHHRPAVDTSRDTGVKKTD